MDNKIIIINNKCGLCNRLRFILQFFKILKIKNKLDDKLIYIIWPTDEMCNGYYLDYFQNIQNNIIFIKNEKELKNYIDPKKIKKIKKIDYINHRFILKEKNKDYLQYKFFKIKEELYHKIRKIIHKMNNKFIAIHVRRTDLDNHLLGFRKKKFKDRTSDEDFFKFIEKYKRYNLYIATDNYNTQKLFISKFNDRIKYIKIISNIKTRRKTSLEDAVIDLFLCSCSYKFKGTFFSSFSDFIKLMRAHINVVRKDKRINPFKSLEIFL